MVFSIAIFNNKIQAISFFYLISNICVNFGPGVTWISKEDEEIKKTMSSISNFHYFRMISSEIFMIEKLPLDSNQEKEIKNSILLSW